MKLETENLSEKNRLDLSKQVSAAQVSRIIEKRFQDLNPSWSKHQMNWLNDVYNAFKNHEKYMIILYLKKKTMDYYSRNFLKLTYDEYYSKNTFEINHFNVMDISKDLCIPKESARRKVIELEKIGAIIRQKKRIIIDKSVFPSVKPINSLKRISRFLSLLSEILVEEGVISNQKKLSSDELEKTIKDNFSYIWKLYYELQVPMMLSWKKIFKDIECWHVWGTCIVNQQIESTKIDKGYLDKAKFISEFFHNNPKLRGINAMSISDITGIPRATVIRKLNILIKKNFLVMNEKKQYKLTGDHKKTMVKNQLTVLVQLADFSSKIYNLYLANKKLI